MQDLDFTLAQLSRVFTVRAIMVPLERLVCASSPEEAPSFLDRHKEFDVIPIRQAGKVSAFVERDRAKSLPVLPQNIVSDSTSILDLVDLLVDRFHYFVLGGGEIVGLVHRSDLNHHLVKLPFFVLLERLEDHFIRQFGARIDRAVLQTVLDPERFRDVEATIQLSESERTNLNLVSQLNLGEIVDCGRVLGVVELNNRALADLTRVRNLVSHAAKGSLVSSRTDVVRLFEVKRICSRFLTHGGTVAQPP